MKVLLDECLPKKLKRELPDHEVTRVQEMGWSGIKNGALVRLIQASDFEVFVTIDGNLEYQQNLRAINFAIIVLDAPDNTFATLRPLMPEVNEDGLNTLKHITQSLFKDIDELGGFFDLEGAAFGNMLVMKSGRMPGCLGKLS